MSRDQLDEQGCSSVVVDKQQMFIAFYCTGRGGPSNAEIPVAAGDVEGLVADPDRSLDPQLANHASLGAPSTPLPAVSAPALSADGWIEVQPDVPLPITIAGKGVELAINTGDLPGVLLNEVAAMRLGLDSRALEGSIGYGGRTTAMAYGTRETVVAMERSAAIDVLWLSGYNQELFSGSIELSSLPHKRLRLRLAPDVPEGQSLRLRLAMPRHYSARGIAELPGIASFVVNAGLHKQWQLPLVSKSLAADLVKVLGGRLVGNSWLETLGYRLRRPVRRLVFARTLIIGPLTFKAVAVQIGGTPDTSNRLARGQDVLLDADSDSDPDEIVVTGRIAGKTGRWVDLSRSQLTEQRCTSLAIDKPAKTWELICRGPV
jgi:hypothetical protein